MFHRDYNILKWHNFLNDISDNHLSENVSKISFITQYPYSGFDRCSNETRFLIRSRQISKVYSACVLLYIDTEHTRNVHTHHTKCAARFDFDEKLFLTDFRENDRFDDEVSNRQTGEVA